MAVYVDDARIEWRGRLWCHLVADDLDELHAFAAQLAFPPSWFHRRATLPHYDVTASARLKAIRHGAVAVGRRELALRARLLHSTKAPAASARQTALVFD